MAKRNREPLREEDKRRVTRTNLRHLAGIFRFMLPYKGLFILGLVALALSSLTLLAFPRLSGELLDVASGKPKFFNTINEVALALLIILFVQSIFSFIRVYTFSIVSEKGMADLRTSVYQKIIWLPMNFFDSRRVGELMSRITSDVGTLQDTFSFTLAELLCQVLTLVFGVAIIFYVAPTLTGFMLLTFPILVIAALIFGKYIRKLSRKTQDKLAEANVVVEESLQSIFIVKAFTNEWLEINRYTRSLKEVVMVAIRSARYRGFFVSFIIFALFGGIVAVGWYGANLVQVKAISVGELFSFVFYTSFIGFSIAGLGDIYTQLQRSIGASERLLEILNLKDEAEPTPETLKLDGKIDFQNVSFSYSSRPDFPVLTGLNFSLSPCEKVALVGQSGAGKSTIINLLMRFYPLQHGVIVGERGVKLSGGQRQRVAIARAILKDPAILILDEATSSLDAHSEVLVQEALEKLMQGRTTIIIAHRLSTIKKADRIFVIQQGQLAEMGSHLELSRLQNGIYSNLLKLQLQ